MIEILNTYEQNSDEDLQSLKQLPRNIRQIGEINESKKIFIEDYVYTYLCQYASSDLRDSQIAILLGHYYRYNDEKVLLISGTVQAKYFFNDDSGIVLTAETWTYIYDKIKEFFEDDEIVGWMYSHPGYSIGVNEQMTDLHMNHFTGSDKVLFVIDPVEKENAFYLYDKDKLKLQEGYYIYYERNERMHQYMLNYRISDEKKAAEPEEDVVFHFRRHISNRKQEVYHKKLVNMLYVTSGALAIIVLVIGVALMNNYDKMKNLETSMAHLSEALSGTSQVEDEPMIEVGEDIEETQETVDEAESKIEASTQNEGIEAEPDEMPPASSDRIYEEYVVQSGDTLAQICFRTYNNMDMIEQLLEINGIENPNKIYTGQTLLLPQP